MEWTLEIVLVVLLLATLVQALRLERALGVLKRDRVALEALIAGFNASTRQAEAGVDRLKAAADGAGRKLEQQIAASAMLKDDLLFLGERGDRIADRLDSLVRAARPLAPDPLLVTTEPATPAQRSEAERNLLQALRLVR
ncbi:DUF6468 domain-containing protein [Rhodopila sp.]|jgi:hypothetical protein|uniref:DUF6468 domain-containing protein n=1 Tax=Rhodopila sp. TaxID=2480087 RepID=UPI002D1D433E|nr:DUF6468 domain-containing protein [Rhodopila sp.]HVZ06814.1 DUF6468 domain-containing protein [Rhodopila sp.]